MSGTEYNDHQFFPSNTWLPFFCKVCTVKKKHCTRTTIVWIHPSSSQSLDNDDCIEIASMFYEEILFIYIKATCVITWWLKSWSPIIEVINPVFSCQKHTPELCVLIIPSLFANCVFGSAEVVYFVWSIDPTTSWMKDGV